MKFICYREDLIHYDRLYMRRWVLRVPALGEIRLHHTLTPDGIQEHLHDHPWSFLTVLLWGSYTHLVQDAPPHGPIVTERRRWLSLRLLRAGAAHVITDVSPGGAWTLVIAAPRSRSWGFWVYDSHVPRTRFFDSHPDAPHLRAEHVNYIGRYP